MLGRLLPGQKKGGNWQVAEKVTRPKEGSGGKFSVGYLVVHEDGTEGFLKATDIGLLTRNDTAADPLTRMRLALNEQDFERRILDICVGNKLDRIVHAIDYGQIEVTDGGVRDIVFYIIFERAKGDVRTQINREKRQGLSWALHALHNLAVALQQLHTQKIAHNDVKPSNFLTFDEFIQKLADLGRATSDVEHGPWDEVKYAGDASYAAPEFWYPNANLTRNGRKFDFSVRKASDLYHLGSMAFFFVTGEKLTPLLRMHLRPEHNPLNWTGNFYDVLPFLRDAMAECMELFDSELPRNENGELLPEAIALHAAVVQLCNPDPDTRGHPLNVTNGLDRYNVERYISQFDSHAKTLRLRERRA